MRHSKYSSCCCFGENFEELGVMVEIGAGLVEYMVGWRIEGEGSSNISLGYGTAGCSG